MAHYEMYLDESGTDRDNRYMYVAGCMMERDEWMALDKRWQDILGRFGIRRFRASDCEAAKGEFNDWSRERRNEIFALLVDEIVNSNCYLVWVGVGKEELKSMQAQQFPLLDITPYELCVLKCHELTALFPVIHKISGTMDLYFERGQNIRQHVRRVILCPHRLSTWGVTTIAFPRKEDHTPYQVADLYAWELLKHTRNLLTGGQKPIRPSLQKLAGYRPERFISKLLKGNDLKIFLDIVAGDLRASN